MKKQISPCLWFDGTGKEAATFYCKHFHNARITAESMMVTEFEVEGQKFICLDGGPQFQPNPSISFFYICETEDETERLWKALSEGGKVMMELAEYPWSKKYGFVQDRFGISWQVALGKISDTGQRITPSLLFTGEQYGRAEEAINHYSEVFDGFKLDGILRYAANEAPDREGLVKHAQFDLEGQKFMIGDSFGPHHFNFTEGISLTIYCDTQEEIDHYWNALTEGGQESMCGWLSDRFGVWWQVIPTVLGKIMSDPAKAGKAANAFMQMRKLNIEQIVQAAL